jgi:hypothetical protein
VKALRSALPFLMLLGFAITANAAEVVITPAQSAWVTDTAGFLTPQTVDALDARLRAYHTTTGHQIRDEQPDQAVVSGVNEILASIGGEAAPQGATPAPEYDASDSGASPAGITIGLFIGLLAAVGVIVLIGKIHVRGPYIAGENSGFGLGDVVSISAGLLGGRFSGGGGSGGGAGATGSW